MKDFAPTGERATKDDEAVLHQGVHEARVLTPAVLFAKIARPVPWPAALETNRVEHEEHLTLMGSAARDRAVGRRTKDRL